MRPTLLPAPPVQSDSTVTNASVQGGAREPQSGFPDGEGGRAGRRLVSKIFSQERFFDVLWSRSSSTPRRRRSSRSFPRIGCVFSSSTALRGAEPRCAGRVAPFSDVILYLRTPALVFMRQSTVASGSVSSCFLCEGGTRILRPIAVRSWKSCNFYEPWCSWISLRMLFGRISQFFHVKAHSALRFTNSARGGYVDFDGVSRGVFSIFRAPPGRLELSASFSSTRALTPVSSLGVVDIHSRRHVQRSTEPEYCQGRGVGSRCTTRRRSGSTHLPGTRHAAHLPQR